MAALEHWQYGDPLLAAIRLQENKKKTVLCIILAVAECGCMDNETNKKQSERDRLHKGRRIRALVKQAMRGGKR